MWMSGGVFLWRNGTMAQWYNEFSNLPACPSDTDIRASSKGGVENVDVPWWSRASSHGFLHLHDWFA